MAYHLSDPSPYTTTEYRPSYEELYEEHRHNKYKGKHQVNDSLFCGLPVCGWHLFMCLPKL